jgi:hypothetical protein
MSTSNRGPDKTLKQDARTRRPKGQPHAHAAVGTPAGSTDPAASPDHTAVSRPVEPVGRGRPRSVDKGQVVSCRLPAEELTAFDTLCTELGAASRSDGLRCIVRMAGGFLEFSRADSDRLEEIRYQLGKIGTNVNQIALAANRGRTAMVRSQWGTVDELRRLLPLAMTTLGQIIAERRRQGVALFRAFAAGEAARDD